MKSQEKEQPEPVTQPVTTTILPSELTSEPPESLPPPSHHHQATGDEGPYVTRSGRRVKPKERLDL